MRVLLLLKIVIAVTVIGASKQGFYLKTLLETLTVVVNDTEKSSFSSHTIALSSTRIDET